MESNHSGLASACWMGNLYQNIEASLVLDTGFEPAMEITLDGLQDRYLQPFSQSSKV